MSEREMTQLTHDLLPMNKQRYEKDEVKLDIQKKLGQAMTILKYPKRRDIFMCIWPDSLGD